MGLYKPPKPPPVNHAKVKQNIEERIEVFSKKSKSLNDLWEILDKDFQ